MAAGRDLAVINSVEVARFGWIRRDQPVVSRLEGVLPTHRAFVLGELEASLDPLRRHFFSEREIDAIQRALSEDDDWLDIRQGRLVHGDFDATHLFHHDGAYTGIIDFGESRGADRLYDLGHFALHDGRSLFPHLLEGYRQVTPVSDDQLSRIARNSLLVGAGRLARSVGRPGVAVYQDFMMRAIRRSLQSLTA
jgi:Ser/Thr protein kinase RdoA (MazF antagonist)